MLPSWRGARSKRSNGPRRRRPATTARSAVERPLAGASAAATRHDPPHPARIGALDGRERRTIRYEPAERQPVASELTNVTGPGAQAEGEAKAAARAIRPTPPRGSRRADPSVPVLRVDHEVVGARQKVARRLLVDLPHGSEHPPHRHHAAAVDGELQDRLVEERILAVLPAEVRGAARRRLRIEVPLQPNDLRLELGRVRDDLVGHRRHPAVTARGRIVPRSASASADVSHSSASRTWSGRGRAPMRSSIHTASSNSAVESRRPDRMSDASSSRSSGTDAPLRTITRRSSSRSATALASVSRGRPSRDRSTGSSPAQRAATAERLTLPRDVRGISSTRYQRRGIWCRARWSAIHSCKRTERRGGRAVAQHHRDADVFSEQRVLDRERADVDRVLEPLDDRVDVGGVYLHSALVDLFALAPAKVEPAALVDASRCRPCETSPPTRPPQ